MKKNRPLEIAGALLAIGLIWSAYKSAPAAATPPALPSTDPRTARIKFLYEPPVTNRTDRAFLIKGTTGAGDARLVSWKGGRVMVLAVKPALAKKIREAAGTAPRISRPAPSGQRYKMTTL